MWIWHFMAFDIENIERTYHTSSTKNEVLWNLNKHPYRVHMLQAYISGTESGISKKCLGIL